MQNFAVLGWATSLLKFGMLDFLRRRRTSTMKESPASNKRGVSFLRYVIVATGDDKAGRDDVARCAVLPRDDERRFLGDALAVADRRPDLAQAERVLTHSCHCFWGRPRGPS